MQSITPFPLGSGRAVRPAKVASRLVAATVVAATLGCGSAGDGAAPGASTRGQASAGGSPSAAGGKSNAGAGGSVGGGGGQATGGTPVCPAPPAVPTPVTVAWAKINSQKPEWYASPEAITVAENILYYQNESGGWSPPIDMTNRIAYKVPEDWGFRTQLLFLASVIAATGCDRYKDAFHKGLDRLLAMQLANGGWVEMAPYGVYYDTIVRFIDDGTTGFLALLNSIVKKEANYKFVDAARAEKSAAGLKKGIDFILKAQIVSQGKKAGWAPQHHRETLAPYQRSAYELPGIGGSEGVGVLGFLMTLDKPSPAVVAAVHAAAAWYEAHKLLGIKVEQLTNDRRIALDPAAPPLWARFYDVDTGNPFFAGRDGVKKWAMAEIPAERRAGYAWYGDWPKAVLEKYATWAATNGGRPSATPSCGSGTCSSGGASSGGAGSGGASSGGASSGGAGGATSGGAPSASCTPQMPAMTSFKGDPPGKPRVIAATDGETDDKSSMVRFLMYSSDYDVAGIVQTNSRYQRNGHSTEKWLEGLIDQYEKVLPNLRVHNKSYPDADKLRGVIAVGNENVDDILKAPPEFSTKDTPGAQLIIDTLLDADPRPVHVPVWGGANTVAYALWKLKTQYTAEQFDYAVSRIRIYLIYHQDAGGYWIEVNVPRAYVYAAYAWDVVWNYQSLFGPSPAGVKAFMTGDWLTRNVKSDHGPLGAAYSQTYISEGDTPSFLPLINNGLEQHTNYALAGWGGRAVYDGDRHMADGWDDCDKNKTYWRWIPAAQNDFAARMDWCVAASFAAANHNPVARVAGDLKRTVKASAVVTLDGSTTTDPDGNALTFKWWQYTDEDSALAKVEITNSDSKTASFVAPNEPGKEVHIVLEVTDDGTPPLTNYQRVIVSVE